MEIDYSKCFAFDKETKGFCSALTVMLCKKKGHCPFFKTREQVAAEKEKTVKRLDKLGIRFDIQKRYKVRY